MLLLSCKHTLSRKCTDFFRCSTPRHHLDPLRLHKASIPPLRMLDNWFLCSHASSESNEVECDKMDLKYEDMQLLNQFTAAC